MLPVRLPLMLGEVAAESAGALSLLPPLLAIGLALFLRRIGWALLIGVVAGALIVARGDVVEAAVALFRDYLVGDSGNAYAHGLILVFTTLLGTMVGVITRNGSMQALIARLIRPGRDRRHGQQLTCGLGLAVFFDDYANTLVVGTSMRPITDRLKISREKLAFLIDATAAPVAGLAVISTWVAFEVGEIQSAFRLEAGQQVNAYWIFVQTLPYRFYSILLLVFVWTVARSGRDFGPMARAEHRAVSTGAVSRVGSAAAVAMDELPEGVKRRGLAVNAVVPLLGLVVVLVAGLCVLGGDLALEVMLAASVLASLVSVVLTLATGALSFRETLVGWYLGGSSMFAALWILVLAWGLGAVCGREALGTGTYLAELVGQSLPVELMPALSFVLAAGIALATGSSFSTMTLLIPISVGMTWNLLEAPVVDDPLMLGALGAVLAGAIFGDHCSPISDTTVLSSAASGCDHLDHVATQAPYAFAIAIASLLVGYVPIGWGVPVVICLPAGLAVAIAIPLVLGRLPGEPHVQEMQQGQQGQAEVVVDPE
jgi:Na+/H+ antiporter NhaC